MKKLLTIAILLFTVSLYAQSEIKITPKNCIAKKGFHLKLKSVVSDSRCPENVTCIWAGEVTAIIEVYKDKKFVEENIITFNSQNREKNIAWFSKYYQKEIKSVDVGPYPKEGVIVKPKKKYILIGF